MAAPILTEDLSHFLPKFIARARMTLQHKTLMKGLCHNEPLPEKQGETLNQPKYGEFEAYDAEEGVEVDNPQIIAQSNVAFTPTEIVAQFLLTDKAIRTGGENHVRKGGQALGDAMAKKLDKKGLATFTSITTHALGSAGTAITVGHVNAAAALLEGNEERTPTPYHFVHRPEPIRVLLNALAPTTGLTSGIPEGLSKEIMEQYLKHDFALFGLKGAFATANLDKDASDDAVGAVFSREAIWYVPADSMHVEKERKVKARAWMFQASHTFTFGLWDESFAVKMTFDAVSPSS